MQGKGADGVEGQDVVVAVGEAVSHSQDDRPKSKKELRAERKKARRLASDPDYAASLMEATIEAKKKEEEREELKRLIQEERKQKQLRQQKKVNREKNSKRSRQQDTPTVMEQPKHGGGDEATTPKASNKGSTKKSKKSMDIADEVDVARKVMHEIKYGSSDETGWTTLQLGVKYKDLVVGKGEMVQNKSLVTVKYQLTGGKFGAVIDSSKKFNFRLGKGEVIQGWDIGMAGMRVGGRRQLVIPPKAGYGSQDIGAGPGGLLHFDVTVLAARV